MASKLTVLNDALGHLGELKLASLTENREARHVLDDKWTGSVRRSLERGFWNFAMRTVQIPVSENVDPAFGMASAFVKPEDWVKTYQLSDNERFDPQLGDLNDEGGYWFADCDPLFVRYVSDDNSYGLDLGRWPQSFEDVVAVDLAIGACYRITGSDNRLAALDIMMKKKMAFARSTDAMNEPPGRLPINSWAASRGASNLQRSRWDRRS